MASVTAARDTSPRALRSLASIKARGAVSKASSITSSGASLASLRRTMPENMLFSRPNREARPPRNPPKAMLSKFSPLYACASLAASLA